MGGMIIDGTKIGNELREKLKGRIATLKARGKVPGLAVILVGDNPASKVYVRMKEKACESLGIYSEKYALSAQTPQDEVLELIKRLNQDEKIHGILVQLPLPDHFNEELIIESIIPTKDVDGFHPINVGNLMLGKALFQPCTPAGVMELLHSSQIDPKGKNAVVVGRSNIVGKPVAVMLLQEHATVTICHSRTRSLADETRRADILIAAIGKPKMITADMVKEGAVVIDVGVNRLPDGSLVGDVDFEGMKDKVAAITPVPGGVGPMTITMLMANTVKSAELFS
ncbi:MAG: bifunctional methylenetetrahydrofolate dehydrogenase/methenyltetrahydrofolate cyclohydrolase FolD [bacterium]|nr:bifunctional methylenetetrahydrofolate dehydrogenase/methenyltetrahydrofolate cyclohydrolase FolD [bacterium]